MVTEEPPLPAAKPEAQVPSKRMPSRLIRGLAPLGIRAKASVRAWIRSGNAAPALLPLIIALPTLWWFLTDMRVAAQTAAGRDQGIFQFIGWSMLKGERL